VLLRIKLMAMAKAVKGHKTREELIVPRWLMQSSLEDCERSTTHSSRSRASMAALRDKRIHPFSSMPGHLTELTSPSLTTPPGTGERFEAKNAAAVVAIFVDSGLNKLHKHAIDP
jgi:hypothetical protein